MDYKTARAMLEKLSHNGEEIGKLKIEPFNVHNMERVRAFYKENDRLGDQLLKLLKLSTSGKDET